MGIVRVSDLAPAVTISIVFAFVHIDRAERKDMAAKIIVTSRPSSLRMQNSATTGASSIAATTKEVIARLKERSRGPIMKMFSSWVRSVRPGFRLSGRNFARC